MWTPPLRSVPPAPRSLGRRLGTVPGGASQAEVVHEPPRGERRYRFQRSGLLEEMRRARDDFQLLHRPQIRERLAVQIDHHVVGSAHDQKGRRAHRLEPLAGEVGPAAARHDRADAPGLTRGRHQRGGSPGARPEQSRRKISRLLLAREPSQRGRESIRQEVDVEAQVACQTLGLLFAWREQIHEQRGKPGLVQRFRHEPVARAEPATPGAVRKNDHAARAIWKSETSAQPQSRAERQLDFALAHVHDSPPRAASALPVGRESSSRTSWSVVWAKSSYQSPTARNGSGVLAHTTSSASASMSAQTDGAATGTATMTRPARSCRNARTAARMVEPVARPSSTSTTARSRTRIGGRSPRNTRSRRSSSRCSRSVTRSISARSTPYPTTSGLRTRTPPLAIAPIASSSCPGKPSLRTTKTSSGAPRRRATSQATGTPPRGSPRTSRSGWPVKAARRSPSARPASYRSRYRMPDNVRISSSRRPAARRAPAGAISAGPPIERVALLHHAHRLLLRFFLTEPAWGESAHPIC